MLFDEPAAGLVGGLGLVAGNELPDGDCLPIDLGELSSDRTVVITFDSGLLLPILPANGLAVVFIGIDFEAALAPGPPVEFAN